jgi:hypothetical protein
MLEQSQQERSELTDEALRYLKEEFDVDGFPIADLRPESRHCGWYVWVAPDEHSGRSAKLAMDELTRRIGNFRALVMVWSVGMRQPVLSMRDHFGDSRTWLELSMK